MSAPNLIQVQILFDADKFEVVGMHGPLESKALCYGILMRAMDKVREFDRAVAKTAKPKLVIPRLVPPPMPPPNGGSKGV